MFCVLSIEVEEWAISIGLDDGDNRAKIKQPLPQSKHRHQTFNAICIHGIPAEEIITMVSPCLLRLLWCGAENER
jgi:hypothetical protein